MKIKDEGRGRQRRCRYGLVQRCGIKTVVVASRAPSMNLEAIERECFIVPASERESIDAKVSKVGAKMSRKRSVVVWRWWGLEVVQIKREAGPGTRAGRTDREAGGGMCDERVGAEDVSACVRSGRMRRLRIERSKYECTWSWRRSSERGQGEIQNEVRRGIDTGERAGGRERERARTAPQREGKRERAQRVQWALVHFWPHASTSSQAISKSPTPTPTPKSMPSPRPSTPPFRANQMESMAWRQGGAFCTSSYPAHTDDGDLQKRVTCACACLVQRRIRLVLHDLDYLLVANSMRMAHHGLLFDSSRGKVRSIITVPSAVPHATMTLILSSLAPHSAPLVRWALRAIPTCSREDAVYGSTTNLALTKALTHYKTTASHPVARAVASAHEMQAPRFKIVN